MSSLVQKQSLDTHQLQLLQTELMSRQKSGGIAWVLLIFAGGLGAHRFYLGRTGTAIAMLLTAGGLGFWVIVDLFLLSGMINETNEQIENEIIRERFEEPRIHFALNCAALGCPPLASDAYTGDRLEEQLESATARTLRDRRWVDLGRCRTYGKGSIRLTKIFDWYAGDFGGEEGIRRFLARYRPESRLPLENEGCSLEYLDYDWSLNRPPGSPTPE